MSKPAYSTSAPKPNGIRGGLAGRIARVDLGSGAISTERTAPYARRFIGGRMINSYLLLNELAPDTNWSDPDNMLIFGVGCLVGTLAPGTCRVSVDTKSPYNNGKGSANFGGHFGPELKYAGFDHLVITGKAVEPVYLWICDETVEIRPAGFLRDATTLETERLLKQELGDDRVRIAAIGPAGENLVRGAMIYTSPGKAAAGSGVGCVMGDKNLKAVAVRGHGAVSVAEPEGFMAAVESAFSKIQASPSAAPWRKGMIEALLPPESPIWDRSGDNVKNGQESSWPMEKRVRLVGRDTGVNRYRTNMTAGFACPIGCLPRFEITDGTYRGTSGVGYMINSAGYSKRMDVDDPAASVTFQLLANELGLDGDMAAVVISWAFECYQRGLITTGDTDGLELDWGNEHAMIELLKMLAHRRGIGDLLAEGVKEAARRLGRGSEDFAIHMKGQDSHDAYRVGKGWALGLATSPVGGRHLRGAVNVPSLSGPKSLDWVPTEYTIAPELVNWQARVKEIEDAMGICVFLGSFVGAHALDPPDYAELINTALGLELTVDDLMLIGRRGINLEKAFNTVHAGFERNDDYPPKRYREEPIPNGPLAGHRFDRAQWDIMLDKFYDSHGWDRKSGWQTRECLLEIGLPEVAEKLEKLGRLKGNSTD